MHIYKYSLYQSSRDNLNRVHASLATRNFACRPFRRPTERQASRCNTARPFFRPNIEHQQNLSRHSIYNNATDKTTQQKLKEEGIGKDGIEDQGLNMMDCRERTMQVKTLSTRQDMKGTKDSRRVGKRRRKSGEKGTRNSPERKLLVASGVCGVARRGGWEEENARSTTNPFPPCDIFILRPSFPTRYFSHL